MLQMSSPTGVGRSVEGGVEEEMLEHGMPLDVVGRTGTSGFFTAHLSKYSELLEGEMQ